MNELELIASLRRNRFGFHLYTYDKGDLFTFDLIDWKVALPGEPMVWESDTPASLLSILTLAHAVATTHRSTWL